MLEIFDHRPMLTAALTLTTTVLLVVVTLLIMLPQSTGPARDSGGGKPAGAAAPANMDAGGENYGWDIHKRGSSIPQDPDVKRHAEVVERLGNGSLRYASGEVDREPSTTWSWRANSRSSFRYGVIGW